MRHAEGDDRTTTTADASDSHAGSGAIARALTGLGLGAFAGLGVLAGVIPVVGPAIAAGTLGVIVSNAAEAGIVGVAGALIGAGVPEHEAKYYDKEFEAGRTIVTVTADGQADKATAILRRHGAYDVSNRRPGRSHPHRGAQHRSRDVRGCGPSGGPRGRHSSGEGGAAARGEAAGRDGRG